MKKIIFTALNIRSAYEIMLSLPFFLEIALHRLSQCQGKGISNVALAISAIIRSNFRDHVAQCCYRFQCFHRRLPVIHFFGFRQFGIGNKAWGML
ncbi:MAG: hypothetical protein QX203_11130 [Methylococcaceae bacterium]